MIKVFLDANIIIRAGRPPGGPLIGRIIDLVNADLITVVTTDLTRTEVAKKQADNDFQVVKDVGRPHFRNLVHETVGVELPAISKENLRKRLEVKYEKLVKEMFSRLKAKELSVNDIKPSIVFDAYSVGQGFFSGQGKRDQFPDAFIFECLKSEATKQTPLTIVSDDGDFVAPSTSVEYVDVLKSIPELFAALGFEIETPDVFDFIDNNIEKIRDMLADELANWELTATDVDDAYIEQEWVVLETLRSFSVFGQIGDERSILVVAKAELKVGVNYTHPDWATATYDSEDKVLIPTMEDVSGETDIRVHVDFSMTITVDEEGKPAGIESVTFRNDRFVFVELNDDGYPYK